MTVLDRSELEASSLADLHLIADQIGLEGFRRLRKADLIDAILGEEKDAGAADGDTAADGEDRPAARRSRSRSSRSRRGGSSPRSADDGGSSERPEGDEHPGAASERDSSARRGQRGQGGRAREERERSSEPERVSEGVVEIVGNGSALVRVHPPGESADDVYVSAAQVRRCELVSGDRVSGPVRPPRRSERHPSLIRIDTINGEPAESVSEGTRYDDLPVSYPSERFSFDSEDSTLKAIEWLTPIGRGSRAVIVGAARSGKTETLRSIAGALGGREGLELALVLAGVRPEEATEWQAGPVAPAATLTFAASPDSQGHAVEVAVDTARRLAVRGGHTVVLIDSLDGLHPHAARKALAAARNLTGGGSLTVIATATKPFGGETTVIALDAVLAGTGRLPALDLVHSGTLKPELLVGDEGATEIVRARAAAAEG
ncbi:MAG TPA: Rho termination factor N-terminal domain-containing protein [Solirubrobacteraceae bacterium]|jgi:transcription termination factor Rho